jgi:predicted DNA-binding protein with PD1-like motif
MSSITAHVFRLRPGQDLKQEIQKYVNEKKLKAGWVSTCVGSLTRYAIRFANQAINNIKTGHFEIINLSGTVSLNGSHIHICVSDHLGRTVGGHLSEGCIIFTTAEIVLLSIDELEFIREADEMSGFNELSIMKVRGV